MNWVKDGRKVHVQTKTNKKGKKRKEKRGGLYDSANEGFVKS